MANRSGVSKSTVSNVIRSSGRMSETTRQRVLDSIQALGYRPNALARDLVRRRANAIGVVVGDLANSFYAELVKLMESAAFERSFTTILCNTQTDLALERHRVETLLERGVLGVVLLQFSGDSHVLDELQAARMPVVVVSCADDRADCVAVDDAVGVGMAVEHLYALGHRTIAHVSGGELVEEATQAARRAGHERAMGMLGLEARVLGDQAWEHGTRAARRLRELMLGGDGLTALTTDNDMLAVRVIDALEAAQVRVPDDVSVVGFDGIDLGAHARIGLTTIAQPRKELAARGLELLLDRVQGSTVSAPPRRVTLASKLVVRHSTAPPRP
ncbi:MAG: LacI family transcriptional regulator [Actinomycetota bacterium]|nr:LacI family transcriptional regulator [Actinomycetota bacterium]